MERFLHFLHNKKIRHFQEDRLLLKESITYGFSVRHMYRKLMYSLPIDFPCRSIWNPIVPLKLGFFAWEASWGKVLTLDQLKRRGIPLVNRCFLCEENEETIDHLLIHCLRAKMLWDLLLTITDSNWVFPVRFDNFSLLGKALVSAKNGREFGWRLFFVYSGRCGWKGIWWFSIMKPLLLTG